MPIEAPPAAPPQAPKEGAGKPGDAVHKGQVDAYKKMAEAMNKEGSKPSPAAAAPTTPQAAAPSDHANEHEHAPEEAIIPTPEFLKPKKSSWPSRRTIIGGAAFACAVINPVMTLPVLAGLWGASKVRNVARKYVPPYRYAEDKAMDLASLPFRGAKALAKTVYKPIHHVANTFVLNPSRWVLRKSLGAINWTLGIPRDILQYVEVHLGIKEKPKGQNKIDAPAVAAVGLAKAVGSIIKTMWNHKVTSLVSLAILYGASTTAGGIPAFLASLSTSIATILSGGLSALGNALTAAPAVAPAATVAAPVTGGSLMWSAFKYFTGL